MENGILGLEPNFELLSPGDARACRAVIFFDPSNGAATALCAKSSGARYRGRLEFALERLNARSVVRIFADEETILSLIDHHETSFPAIERPLERTDTQPNFSNSKPQHISNLTLAQEPESLIRYLDSILLNCIRMGASDIHFETGSKSLVVRARVDGLLSEIAKSESETIALRVIARIKYIANLDITEQRIPQDGRFQVQYRDRVIDFRVSIIPNQHSEDAAIRILDRQALLTATGKLTLDSLGLSSECKYFLRTSARRPHGLLLVTGPTGSGKTTTLYASLSEVATSSEKIISIEDPIEYEIPGLLQIPVNERKGLTFAKGLRSILRHDPDRIMVGEIRDEETTQIAIQAALTGHQVLTTVHANGVVDVIERMYSMGASSHGLASSLTGILAQRLVRRLCPVCRASPSQGTPEGGYLPAGCPACRQTGYKGRVAVSEWLAVTDPVRDLLSTRPSLAELRSYVKNVGMLDMRASVLQLVAEGVTSLAEADRAIPPKAESHGI